MSRWTHIAGMFRVDSLRMGEPELEVEEIKKAIKETLGPIIRWGDPREIWDKGTKLPLGSEGSLEYNIITSPDPSDCAFAVVPVWGDLRDFGSEAQIKEVEDWFNSACKKLWIRQAIIEIQDEWGENSKVLVYKEEEENK